MSRTATQRADARMPTQEYHKRETKPERVEASFGERLSRMTYRRWTAVFITLAIGLPLHWLHALESHRIIRPTGYKWYKIASYLHERLSHYVHVHERNHPLENYWKES